MLFLLDSVNLYFLAREVLSMAERKNGFGEIRYKSLFHTRVVLSLSLSLLVLRFGFFFFSFQSLSRFFKYFEVKTSVDAGKSMEMHCYRCYHWVNKWSFLLPLTDSLYDNIFYSYFLENLFLKIFFLSLEKCFKLNASTWMVSGLLGAIPF